MFLIAVFAFHVHWQLTQSETLKYGIVAHICSKQFDIVSVGSIALLIVVSFGMP
jgi:hypothetical protein